MYCKNILTLLSLVSTVLTGCLSTGNYEKHYFIANKSWAGNDAKAFSVSINDTSQAYYQYLYLQQQYEYLYSNIWIQIETISPSGKADTSKPIEVGLSLPNGQWLGSTANGIANEKINISPEFGVRKFSERGVYKINVRHIMRDDPLKGIIKIGMGLEHAQLANLITPP